jgi:hypothetical protein
LVLAGCVTLFSVPAWPLLIVRAGSSFALVFGSVGEAGAGESKVLHTTSVKKDYKKRNRTC